MSFEKAVKFIAKRIVGAKPSASGTFMVERISARNWYGRHSTGSVILVNGRCSFHGDRIEATKFYKSIMAM